MTGPRSLGPCSLGPRYLGPGCLGHPATGFRHVPGRAVSDGVFERCRRVRLDPLVAHHELGDALPGLGVRPVRTEHLRRGFLVEDHG